MDRKLCSKCKYGGTSIEKSYGFGVVGCWLLWEAFIELLKWFCV